MSAVQTATASQAILSALNVSRDKTASTEGATQDRFLKLLVTQLKNQDPLNPMDNAQMTSQLAQISTVDGISKLNATLEAMMASSTDTQALQAANLVGHGVLVPGRGMSVQEGVGIAGMELAEPADRVVAVITDSNGLVVRSLDLGARAVGNHAYSWDGLADNGQRVADGSYRVDLKATRGSASFTPAELELGVVSGVTRGTAGVSVDVSGKGLFRFDEIKRII